MTQAAWLFYHRSESRWTETCLLCTVLGCLWGCEAGWLGEVLAGGVVAVMWVRFLGSLAWLLLFPSLKRASSWACQLDQSQRPGRHAPRGGRFRLEKAQSNCKSQLIDNLSGWGCDVSYRGYAAGLLPSLSSFSSACSLHSVLPSWPSLCLCLWCLPSRYSGCFFLRMSSIGGIWPVGAPSGQPATTWVQILPPPLLAVWLWASDFSSLCFCFSPWRSWPWRSL